MLYARARILTVLVAIASIGMVLGYSLQAHAQEGDPAAIDAGKTVFSLNCSNEFCHGPRGGGNFLGTPNAQKLTDNAWFRSDGSYNGILKIITEGVPGSPMEPWGGKLSEERIRHVAAFVKSLSAE